MQNKEEQEDEELLEEYKDKAKSKKSDEQSEIDEIGENEGKEGELIKEKLQAEGYEEDKEDENESVISEGIKPAIPEGDMDLDEVDENANAQNRTSNIDITDMSNFKPYLKAMNFSKQEESPNFKRASLNMTLNLSMDSKSKLSKILMLSLVEAILQKVLIRSVKGINKSYVIERNRKNGMGKEKVIQTEGINFEACYNEDEVFDLDRLETNDINQMMKHYGIEAARNSIVSEVKNVFDAYGIGVDYRHLSLIADFMTQHGTYKPFNRIGMQDSNSPFLKASFETSTAFLTDSCTKQDLDDNTTPASSIVLGQIPKIGTGVFDIFHDHTSA